MLLIGNIYLKENILLNSYYLLLDRKGNIKLDNNKDINSSLVLVNIRNALRIIVLLVIGIY